MGAEILHEVGEEVGLGIGIIDAGEHAIFDGGDAIGGGFETAGGGEDVGDVDSGDSWGRGAERVASSGA